MSRFFSLLYGTVAYVLFLIVFLYAIGFVGNFIVPKTIDSGAVDPMQTALLINLVLLALFAVQHTIMARPAFKRWWTKIIPAQIERSTFVLVTNLILALIFWQWRPMPDMVWSTESDIVATILIVLFWVGWGMVLVSTFLIDHFDLFGMRQVVLYYQEKEYTTVKFVKKGLYKYVRHPLLLGFIIAFWATPDMSVGHLLFAAMTTVYMFIGIKFEEKDLVAEHGAKYEDYRREVPALIPLHFGSTGMSVSELEESVSKE